MFRAENLMEQIDSGSILVGTHVSLDTPYVSEMLGECGFDCIWIDAEHCALDRSDIQNHLLACKASDTAGIVRVPANDPMLLKSIMDMGADGVIVPMVNSVEDAQKLAKATHYPPNGIRGMGLRRAVNYGLGDKSAYLKNTDRALLTFAQFEDIRALDELEEIVKVDGISGFIIGPNDFSISMNTESVWHTPQDEEVKEKLEEAARIIKASGKLFGVSGVYSESFVKYWLNLGVNIIFVNFDFHYIVQGGKTALAGTKEAIQQLESKEKE